MKIQRPADAIANFEQALAMNPEDSALAMAVGKALVATHEGEQDSDSPSAGKEELGVTPRPVGVVEGKAEAEPAQHSGAAHALLDPFEPGKHRVVLERLREAQLCGVRVLQESNGNPALLRRALFEVLACLLPGYAVRAAAAAPPHSPRLVAETLV